MFLLLAFVALPVGSFSAAIWVWLSVFKACCGEQCLGIVTFFFSQ